MSMSLTELERALKSLRLSGMTATLEARALQVAHHEMDFVEAFGCLVQDELDRRRSRLLERRFQLEPSKMKGSGPARYLRVTGRRLKIGFITPMSQHFCESCNRVRMSCTGELFMCLGQEDNADLRAPLRAHPNDDAPLIETIRDAITRKPKGHDFDYSRQRPDGQMSRHMSHTGG